MRDIFFSSVTHAVYRTLRILLIAIGCLGPLGSTASVGSSADIPVSGRVVDAKSGESLPGANIVIKGTRKGVTTDKQGDFTINVPGPQTVLVVTLIGYTRQEVTVGNISKLTIRLEEGAQNLDEVVVVGYGEIRKSDLTGAVSQLKVEGNEDKPILSVDQLMQGRMAGVQITQNSGAPGAGMTFLIRGASSITGSTQPLIIVDGFPIEAGTNALGANTFIQGDISRSAPPTNPLAALNPNDIESIEVLKDASSTAIYGSRGANGVVLITTKRGRAKRDQVSYTFRFDHSRLPRKIDMLNTAEFVQYANEARRNSSLDSAYRQADLPAVLANNYDWQDLIYQDALSQEHQISVSGSDDRTNYLLSANYANQIGIVKNSFFRRYGLRANVERKVTNKFKVIANISGSYNVNRSAQQNNQNGSPQGSVVTGALTFRPLVVPFASDDQSDPNVLAENNPLTLIQRGRNLSLGTVVLANLKAQYQLTKGLTFATSFGANYNQSNRDAFLPVGTAQGTLSNGYAFRGESNLFTYLTENTLSFNHTLKNKSRINAVVGYTYQKFMSRNFAMAATNFASQLLGFDQLSLANATTIPVTANQAYSLSSYLGRINYAIGNRYLLTFTGRADGASRLPQANKWAFFPSAALGWNVHNESFMKNLGGVNELKLRASIGLTGNQNVGLYAPIERVQVQRGVVNTNIVSGLLQSTLANRDARWETTTQWNAGFDLAVLNNRLRFSAEVYNRHTKDLIISLPLPTSSGFLNYNGNVGSVVNRGVELDLRVAAADKAFKWDIITNFSANRNKVTSLPGQILGENFMANFGLQQPITTAIQGYPIGSFFGYQLEGLYQTREEIAASPRPVATVLPGDFKFRDVNGDGAITDRDRTIVGNPFPDFSFGLTNDLSYKNFSLSVFVMGNIGQDVANINRFSIDGMNYLTLSNVRREAYENRWTGPGTSNYYPAPRGAVSPSYQYLSDFLIEDASFVRLKNVTLSYAFPAGLLRYVRSARVFVTGTNLFVLTNYKGYDPEVNGQPVPNMNSLTTGIDNGTIPLYRTFSAGLTVGF